MMSFQSNIVGAAMTHIAVPAIHHGAVMRGLHPAPPAPQFLWQEAMSCCAVGMLVIARLHEPKYPQFYSVSVVCAAICTCYGFSSGAWPLGFAMGAYTIRLLTQRPRKHIRRVYDDPERPARASYRWVEPTRLERLFGSK